MRNTYKRCSLAIIFTACFAYYSSAQGQHIFVQAEGDTSGIELTWLPFSHNDYFEEMYLGGYSLIRNEVQLTLKDSTLRDDGEYNYILDTTDLAETQTVLFDTIDPYIMKDSFWFAENGDFSRGMADMIGSILYDPTVDIATEDLPSQVAAYEYIKFCYLYHRDLLPALALGYTDNDIDPRTAYRYTLTPKFSPYQEVSIVIASVPYTSASIPQDYSIDEPEVEIAAVNDRPDALTEAITISVASKPMGDSIILKWIPSDAIAFDLGLKSGYRLMRKTTDDWEEIDIVKPWTKEQYDLFRGVNDTAFIATSMIVHGDFAADATNEMEQSNAIDDKYAFGAYTFELSQLAAEAMGLRYVDRSVLAGEDNEYRIELVDETIGSVFGITTVGLPEPLQAPEGLVAEEGEYEIKLNLAAQANRMRYTFYFFDRSEDDGASWMQIHEKPILFAETSNTITDFYQYKDSVDVLYKDYKYRVRGQDPFGELSPPSFITAQAIDLTPPAEAFMDSVFYEEGIGARIQWSNSDIPTDYVGSFVQLSTSLTGEYRDVSSLLLEGTSDYTYTTPVDPNQSYFFRVANIDENENRSFSIAMQLPLIDSIPPSAPSGLGGFIDENGIAYLTWEHGSETDLVGYRVYFSNSLENEFSQLTKDVIDVNLYTDTVALNIINEEIYYVVEAQDDSYNRSAFSEVSILKRPDIIPPVAPAMLAPVSIPEGIRLQWNASSSTDVVRQLLYQRLLGESEWQLISQLDPETETFIDSLADYEVVYEYAIQVEDDAELLSEMTLPLQGRRYFEKEIIPVINLSTVEDDGKVILTWDYVEQDNEYLKGQDYRYQIFRSENQEQIQRYIQLVSKDSNYTDTEIAAGGEYVYAVQVLFDSGKVSDLSEPVYIKIED